MSSLRLRLLRKRSRLPRSGIAQEHVGGAIAVLAQRPGFSVSADFYDPAVHYFAHRASNQVSAGVERNSLNGTPPSPTRSV